MTSITIPYTLRREIAAYCSHAISPQRYYIHNAIGGTNWRVAQSSTGSEWYVEASEQHLIILRLKLGV